ncbi:MAG: hypothetical protein NVSMB45_16480 [Ginsengibacter sp.]
MKFRLFILALLFAESIFSQTIVMSKTYGKLEFVELDHGVAKVKDSIVESLSHTPTGTHGWLKDFEIIKVTDSVKALIKANFGVVYMINAKDTADIDVTIEWIYPEKVINKKGEGFKSIKYSSRRPTNIPSASSYSLDEPYELVKGNWQMNIYIENKKVYSKTFFLF